MQKKLIALAIAGLVSAPAFAQSNVTIYGGVDMGVSHRSQNTVSGVGSKTSVDSGILNGSRLGFRGTEDLGNGLKAGFVLEMGLFVDQGISRTDGTFSRQSFVTLGGNFGTLSLGRQYTPQHVLVNIADPFQTGTVGAVNNVYGYDARLNNLVAYTSPTFGGLNVVAGYTKASSGNETLDNPDTDSKVWVIAPTYKNGPLAVGANFHRIEAAAALNAKEARTNVWDLGGSYDFGVVKLGAIYGQRNVDGAVAADDREHRQWMVGATVPVGAAGSLLASYTRWKEEELNDKASMWAVGYVHNLSKRTALYSAYARIDNKDLKGILASKDTVKSVGDASNVGENYEAGFNVGIRHWF